MTQTASASCRFSQPSSSGVATFWVDADCDALQRMLWIKLYLAGWFMTFSGVCFIYLVVHHKGESLDHHVLCMLVRLLLQAAFCHAVCKFELAQHHHEQSTLPYVYYVIRGVCQHHEGVTA